MALPIAECPAHAQFEKRIDDRWDDHIDSHVREKTDLCKKIEMLFDLHRKLESKINWLLGGMAAGAFVTQIVINILSKGHLP